MSREVFVDTASLDDVLLWSKRGVVDGVTTNQRIFLSEGNIDFKRRVLAICDAVPSKPVSVELTGHGAEALIAEALDLARWRPNIVIKVPMTIDGCGLEVVTALASRGLATNATIMMTAEQLVLAARAGATYVSLFYNRALDGGEDPQLEIAKARRFLDAGGYRAKIIAGSIRAPKDVGNAYDAGADIVTIPPKILSGILAHPKTAETVREFDAAWKEFRRQAPVAVSATGAETPPNGGELVEVTSPTVRRR